MTKSEFGPRVTKSEFGPSVTKSEFGLSVIHVYLGNVLYPSDIMSE